MMVMSNQIQILVAIPDDCNAMMSRTVEDEHVKRVGAYCDECERRHGFMVDNG